MRKKVISFLLTVFIITLATVNCYALDNVQDWNDVGAYRIVSDNHYKIKNVSRGYPVIELDYAIEAFSPYHEELFLEYKNGEYSILTTSMYHDGKEKALVDKNEIYAFASYLYEIKDVKNHWSRRYAYWAVARGVAPISADGNFYPDQNITRAEFTKVMANLSMEDLSDYNYQVFNDVEDEEYLKYITWASENKIIYGVGDDNFAPNSYITREEMATIFGRYITAGFEYPIDFMSTYTSYEDEENISEWALNNVYAMRRCGLMNGYNDNTFAPKSYITRAESSAMVYNYIKAIFDANYGFPPGYTTITVEE